MIIDSFIAKPSPTDASLSARPHTPTSAQFALRLSQGSVTTFNRALRPMMVSSSGQSLYREPLRPKVGVTYTPHGTETRVTRSYPGFLAHTGSCARPTSSLSLGFPLVPCVFAGCCAPLLDVGLSQRYLRESFSGCLDPYPGGSPGALTRFFPRGRRPSPRREWFGTQQSIRTATSVRSGFSGLQSFANVQASRFARHPGCSHRIKVSLSGQPWLLLPRISRFVTSPSSGYASRPKSGN